MRVALVHECIAGYHGSERVLAELAGLYPDAPIYVLIHQREATADTPLAGRDLRASFLDRLPWLRDRHRLLLPLMPLAVERHDLREFDLILSSHHAVAHGVLTSADQLHLCYTHSPARYAWDLYHQHLPPSRPAPVRRWLLHRFRIWDAAAGRRPDAFAANSRHVARRIEKTYRRPAEVIYPPVQVDRFSPAAQRSDAYLLAGRLVPYKNADAAITACLDTGRRLIVMGDGPQRRALERQAKSHPRGELIEFLGAVDEATWARRMGEARALLFPGVEDFGITAVEALAAGTPVVGLGRGGLREIVHDGQTGLWFDEPTPAAIGRALDRFEAERIGSDPGALQSQAQRFAPDVFRRRLADWVQRSVQLFEKDRICPKP